MVRAIWVLSVLLAAALGVPAQEPAALALTDGEGKRRTLADYRGRIVVLNFWATWCVPCREEMPLLLELSNEYEARGVTVIGASADDASTQDKIAPFVRELGITFPIWLGATTGDTERFGAGTALPATVIVDRDGRILFRIRGPVEEAELRARLDWLLGDRTGASPEAELDTFARAAAEHAGHKHEGEEDHRHGGVALEGASSVPS